MNMKIFSTILLSALVFISACEDQGNPVTTPTETPTPSITAIAPDSGKVTDTVKIAGTNFGSVQGTGIVKFGIVSATTFKSWSATQIEVIIPTGATTDSISVTVNNKTSNKKIFKVLIAANAPNITSVTPDSGKVGDTITVNGTNFGTTQSSSTVSFGATNATTIVLWSATQLKVVVPNGVSIGTTTIAMTVNSQSSNAKAFKVFTPVTIISFLNDIRPLINNYGCSGCHPGNAGFSVTTHADIISRVTINNGDGSLLVQKLRGMASGDRMPRGGPFMTSSEIQKFVDWINQGALNN